MMIMTVVRVQMKEMKGKQQNEQVEAEVRTNLDTNVSNTTRTAVASFSAAVSTILEAAGI